MSDSDPSASDIARLRDASEWVQRLSESEGPELTDQWMQWCKSDGQNLPAFEQMQRLWDAFSEVESPQRPAPGLASRLPRRMGLTALAAGVLLVAGVTAWLARGYFDVQQFATPLGKQRSIMLADGTHLDLAPDSLVRTRFTLTRREVNLERGQAFFAVAHNPVRPFVVQVGGLTVTAIGTAFDVRVGPSSAAVTVSEGRVRVSPGSPAGETIRASAGQRVTLSNSAHRLEVTTVDPKVAESWRDGKLQFVGESLEEVVAEVNRYGAAPIVVAPAMRQTRFTGTVMPNKVYEWLKAVEQIYGAEVVDQGVGGMLIRSRADHGARK